MTIIQNVPAEQQPFKYIYGLTLSNDATTPNTKIDVSVGQCRDSNDVIDMVYSTTSVINAAVNGFNGLDTGSLANNTFYSIYAIADSSNKLVPGFIISLMSNSAPLMPFGYDSYRVIGFNRTNGSAQFFAFYVSSGANTGLRYYQYDAPVSITVTASGTSTSYSAMDLSLAVPSSRFAKVKCYAKWTPNAAGNTLTLQATGGTGNLAINTAVGTVAQDFIVDILPLVSGGLPEISYKVSTASATLNTFTVMGYEFIV